MIREVKTKSGIKHEGRVKIGGRPYSRRFETRKEAERWVTEMRYRRDSRIPFLRSVSIDDLWSGYLEAATARGRAATTLAAAKQRFEKYIKPVFEGQDMTAISVEQHEKFMNSMKGHFNISDATCNRVRSLMAVMFSTAIRKRFFGGAIQVNPYQFIEKKAEIGGEFKYWTTDSIQKFLDHVKKTPHFALWVLMLNTGMRPGEVIALDRSQIDTFAHFITVRHTWCPVEKKVATRTKGKKSRRIGINKELRHALYPILPVSGPVFVAPTGKRLSRDTLGDMLPRLCKEAGVEYITLKGLRHTFASQYMMAGGNINDLSETLGHTTVELTRKFYIHFSEEHLQKRGRVIGFTSSDEKVIKGNFKA